MMADLLMINHHFPWFRERVFDDGFSVAVVWVMSISVFGDHNQQLQVRSNESWKKKNWLRIEFTLVVKLENPSLACANAVLIRTLKVVILISCLTSTNPGDWEFKKSWNAIMNYCWDVVVGSSACANMLDSRMGRDQKRQGNSSFTSGWGCWGLIRKKGETITHLLDFPKTASWRDQWIPIRFGNLQSHAAKQFAHHMIQVFIYIHARIHILYKSFVSACSACIFDITWTILHIV